VHPREATGRGGAAAVVRSNQDAIFSGSRGIGGSRYSAVAATARAYWRPAKNAKMRNSGDMPTGTPAILAT
jgi:hypothetical protein